MASLKKAAGEVRAEKLQPPLQGLTRCNSSSRSPRMSPKWWSVLPQLTVGVFGVYRCRRCYKIRAVEFTDRCERVYQGHGEPKHFSYSVVMAAKLRAIVAAEAV